MSTPPTPTPETPALDAVYTILSWVEAGARWNDAEWCNADLERARAELAALKAAPSAPCPCPDHPKYLLVLRNGVEELAPYHEAAALEKASGEKWVAALLTPAAPSARDAALEEAAQFVEDLMECNCHKPGHVLCPYHHYGLTIMDGIHTLKGKPL